MVQSDRHKLVDLTQVFKGIVILALLPVLVLTYYWWGYKYYSSVIN